jgi:hypothetical protein
VRAWLPEAAALSVADVQRLTAGTGDGASEVPAETLLALARRVLDDLRRRARARVRAWSSCCTRASPSCARWPRAPSPWCRRPCSAKQRFIARWNEALADAGSTVPTAAAQERALSEAAAFAIRIDVAEELGRLRAHLDEIESVLEKAAKPASGWTS